ncbi:MAG TPA: hypothetical protein VGJ26_19490 [Pirellulales bacterium]|jgi:hypothetical protein
MLGVWKQVFAMKASLLCGLLAIAIVSGLASSAGAIHRRGRIAHGMVAGADVVAYDRPCALAPGISGNPVGFGFGGYSYGGYPLYGYAQYLPAAYDGYGAVGYTPAVAVGLPGGYGSGRGYTANLGVASAEPYLATYAPADVAAPCAGLSPRAYRRYVRRMCSAMARLTWVYFPMPIPLLDCSEELLGDEAFAEEVEATPAEGAAQAEEVSPMLKADEPMPEGARSNNKRRKVDEPLLPETLEAPAVTEEGPSLRYLLERDL